MSTVVSSEANKNLGETSHDPKAPILSILVTTFNRGVILEGCMAQLCLQVSDLPPGEIEIVVSDNRSPDNTAAVLERYSKRYSFMKGVRTPVHFPAAEQNLFSGLKHCRGEFIWPFGDDDYLAAGAIARVIELIKTRPHDFYLLNSAHVAPDGTVLAARTIQMIRSSVELTMLELVQGVGLITIAASFTSTIMRRDPLMRVDHSSFIRISPIYSHVAVYIAAYAHSTCLVVNEQLVTLRAGTGSSAFKTFSKHTGAAYYDPWTLGFGRLMAELGKQKLIPGDLLYNTLECDGGGRFWTWANVIHLYIRQLEQSLRSERGADREILETFTEFRAHMVGGPPASSELFVRLDKVVQLIKVLHQAIAPPKTQSDPKSLGGVLSRLSRPVHERLTHMISHRIRGDLAALQADITARIRFNDLSKLPVVATVGDYEIYRVTFWYYAVHRSSLRSSDLDPTVLDPVSNFPHWVVAKTTGELRSALAGQLRAEPLAPPILHRGYKVWKTAVGAFAIRDEIAAQLAREQIQELGRHDIPNVAITGDSVFSIKHQIDTGLDRAAGSSAPPLLPLEALRDLFDDNWFKGRTEGLHLRAILRRNSAFLEFTHALKRHDIGPNRFFDIGWYRTMYNLEDARGKTVLLHYLNVGRHREFSPSPLFDEAWYLATYPEIRSRIEAGLYLSGLHHFLRAGRYDGFDPHAFFSSEWYADKHPDAALACLEGKADSVYDFFLTTGIARGDQPHPNFVEEDYLTRNKDVRAAVKSGGVPSGWYHFLTYGRFEGRRASPEFASTEIDRDA